MREGGSRPRLVQATGLSLLALAVLARPAAAYIDPGTGSAVFSALAPVLAVLGVAAVAVLGLARTHVRVAAGVLWRRRLVVIGALVLLGAVVAVAILARRGAG